MRIFISLSALLLSSIVSATTLSSIVVFGDSLSDNGNFYELSEHQFPTSPPYFEGRFSNGPVWVEDLMRSYFPAPAKLPMENYAFGGAAVALDDTQKQAVTLQHEIGQYLTAHKQIATEDSLFVVWIGANNYLSSNTDPDHLVQDVNAGIKASLKLLGTKGAKHIMVINLPDLGKSPIATPATSEALSYISASHNDALQTTVTALKESMPDITWIYYDANAAFSAIRENPAKYGYDNVSQACLEVAPGSNCSTFFFFDSVHPTAYTHQLLGETARLLLEQANINFQ